MDPSTGRLTDAQLRVLRALASCGGSTKDAARRLGTDRATVRAARAEAYARLGAPGLHAALAAIGLARAPR